MTNLPTPLPSPYLPHNPGDLITAEDWNAVQNQIRDDIGKQIKQAVGDIKKVDQAGDADTLKGQTPKTLEDDIIKQVLQKLAGQTGYRMIFRVLELNKEDVIKHDLQNFPLVDVYQLEYFKVACATGEDKSLAWVNFYLYNGIDEGTIRFTPTGATASVSVDIEPKGSQAYKVPFGDMLRRYNVAYDDKSTLEDVVGRFWKAFFSDPNDRFSTDQYCHSPWFERCCREDRAMGNLGTNGLDDLFFQMRPTKTINFPYRQPPALPNVEDFPLPHNVQVSHFDFSTLGVKLLLPPIYPPQLLAAATPGNPSPINKDQLKVMLLLKV